MAEMQDIQARINKKADAEATKDWQETIKAINKLLETLTSSLSYDACKIFVAELTKNLQAGCNSVYIGRSFLTKPLASYLDYRRSEASQEFIERVENLVNDVNVLYGEVESMQL